jgi:branched-chain amino acid transport system substrate-binding protein
MVAIRFTILATASFVAVAFCCVARADIVVGVAVPSLGPKVALAAIIRDTLTADAASLNDRGGINAQTVALSIEDDGCSAEGGAAVAAKFVAAQVALVIGHPCSNAAIAAAAIYARANIMFVAVGASHPALTAKRAGPAVFRLGGRDDRQAVETAALMAPLVAQERVAIVHDRTAYAKALAEGVTVALKTAGVTPTLSATLVASEKTYPILIAQLKAAQIQTIYFAGFPHEAELIISELHQAGVYSRVFGSETLASLKAPRLTVITPRQISGDDITGLIGHMFSNGPTIARSNPLQERHIWAETGDELLPSFTPQPLPSK